MWFMWLAPWPMYFLLEMWLSGIPAEFIFLIVSSSLYLLICTVSSNVFLGNLILWETHEESTLWDNRLVVHINTVKSLRNSVVKKLHLFNYHFTIDLTIEPISSSIIAVTLSKDYFFSLWGIIMNYEYSSGTHCLST